MEKRYAIRVRGTDVYVKDAVYTTPIPMLGESIPSRCVVKSVTFTKDAGIMTFMDRSFASAMADGIKNLFPSSLEVIETWRVSKNEICLT